MTTTTPKPRPAHRPEPGGVAIPDTGWSPLSAGWIRAYALFWIAGLGFLWWPAIAFRAVLLRRGELRAAALPVAISILLGLSLVVAAMTGGQLTRLAGAGYNLVVWVALAGLTRYYLPLTAICRGIAHLAALQSVAVLAAFSAYPLLSGMALPSRYALPGALTQDPAFESFTRVRLIAEDYFGESVLRSAGFFGNATWGGALSALGVLTSLVLLSRARTRRIAGWYGALLVVDAVVLYLSYSRNTWIALGAALAAMGAVELKRRRSWSALTLLAGSVVAVATWIATSLDMADLLEDFNSVREGSYDSRTAIYRLTWQAVLDLPFPLLGNGIKERVPGLVASMGTHGTYLGILYRGGWLVAPLLVVWLVVLTARSLRHQSALGVGSTIFVAIWLVAEDFDAGHLAPLALVLALAATRSGRHTASGERGQQDLAVTPTSLRGPDAPAG